MLVDFFFQQFGLKLTTLRAYRGALEKANRLADSEARAGKLDLIAALFIDGGLVKSLESSQSQLGQDYLAYLSSGRKKNGFFVEFGAVDGINLSNTFLLEKTFGWPGILAEPNKRYFSKLSGERSARLDPRAVGPESGLTLDFLDAGLNSSLHYLRNLGRWGEEGASYTVETVSLLDLLIDHEAPHEIDFLSVDTEGNEFATLAAFDFSRFEITCICVEANGQEAQLSELLTENGYVLVLQDSPGGIYGS